MKKNENGTVEVNNSVESAPEMPEVKEENTVVNEPEVVGTVNKNAYRTASIEFLRVVVAYADFKKKEFGEAIAFYYDDVNATDEKILKDLSAETGKVFQAVISRELLSGLYKIKNSDYVAFGERIGDAREKKADK